MQPIDDDNSVCSVYTPVLPGSIFWIGYAVSPPVPNNHYFLFKLYIDGAHIVSWDTGRLEKWKGKTMFALYERRDEDGRARVEKRALCFMPPQKKDQQQEHNSGLFNEQACIEVKVHRAHNRRRVERKLEEYKQPQHVQGEGGIRLVNAGRASSEHPKRFYQYALIDPVDQPFTTFRFCYRTWDQLQELGMLENGMQASLEDNNLPVIEPYEQNNDEDEIERVEEVLYDTDRAAKQAASKSLEDISVHLRIADEEPPRTPQSIVKMNQEQKHSFHDAQNDNDTPSPTAYLPHPAWTDKDQVRKPSPLTSQSCEDSTPVKTSEKQKTTLLSVISATWKRRGKLAKGH
jgi:hypothetical protein